MVRAVQPHPHQCRPDRPHENRQTVSAPASEAAVGRPPMLQLSVHSCLVGFSKLKVRTGTRPTGRVCRAHVHGHGPRGGRLEVEVCRLRPGQRAQRGRVGCVKVCAPGGHQLGVLVCCARRALWWQRVVRHPPALPVLDDQPGRRLRMEASASGAAMRMQGWQRLGKLERCTEVRCWTV